MKRTIGVGIIGVLVVAALAAKPLKYPWAGADWNAEVTMTKLELELLTRGQIREPIVLAQSGGKPVWSATSITATAEENVMKLTAVLSPHFKGRNSEQGHSWLAGTVEKHWKASAGFPPSWPTRVILVIDGKQVYSAEYNVKESR